MPLPIVYLHGLFGDPLDFIPMQKALAGVALTLPSAIGQDSFIDKLLQDLRQHTPCILIGYSLGGRLALTLQDRYPELFPKIICLSSHLGVQTDLERDERKIWEDRWIKILEREPIEEVLHQWYAQPLFASFRGYPQFPETLAKRRACDLEEMAALFNKMRRSKMDTILPPKEKALFLVGKEDLSALTHYQKHLPKEQYRIIEKAGHCLHIENPVACLKEILPWLGVRSS